MVHNGNSRESAIELTRVSGVGKIFLYRLRPVEPCTICISLGSLVGIRSKSEISNGGLKSCNYNKHTNMRHQRPRKTCSSRVIDICERIDIVRVQKVNGSYSTHLHFCPIIFGLRLNMQCYQRHRKVQETLTFLTFELRTSQARLNLKKR
jgi:hypothetical protein